MHGEQPAPDRDALAAEQLTKLRHDLPPGSALEVICSELAVIRAALARVVTAISGDPAIGVDGIIVDLKRQRKRLSDLEAAAGSGFNFAKLTRRDWKLIAAVVATAFPAWGKAILDWLAAGS